MVDKGFVIQVVQDELASVGGIQHLSCDNLAQHIIIISTTLMSDFNSCCQPVAISSLRWAFYTKKLL